MDKLIAELRQLVAERKELVGKMKPLSEKRELTPEEKSAWDELTAKVAEHDAKIMELESKIAAEPPVPEENTNKKLADLEKRNKDLEAKLSTLSVRQTPPMFVSDLGDRRYTADRKTAMRGWGLGRRARDEHRSAAERIGVDISSPDFDFKLLDVVPRSLADIEKRGTATQVAGTGSLGGYAVPTVLADRIEEALLYFNPMRQYADVIRTDSGETWNLPGNDDTGTKGELLAEGSAVTVADTTLTNIALGAYTFNSKAVKISWQLLEDSAFDMEDFIGRKLGERIGRILADYTATGTGSSQPEGIANASTGKTTASATAITSAEILDLIHSVDVAYRQDPSAALVMHDSVWLYVRKLVDSNGLPLFQENFRSVGEIRVHGYPVIIHNSMASSVATGNKTMVFGALKKFLIRDVKDIRIQRLDELYAANGTVGFLGWFRSDSKIVASGAIKKMVQA